jgi:hypothetical protein
MALFHAVILTPVRPRFDQIFLDLKVHESGRTLTWLRVTQAGIIMSFASRFHRLGGPIVNRFKWEVSISK